MIERHLKFRPTAFLTIRKFYYITSISVIIFLFHQSSAQVSSLPNEKNLDDSVESVLKKAGSDTSKLRVYYNLCTNFNSKRKYQQLLKYAFKAISFGETAKCGRSILLSKIRLMMSAVFTDQVTDIAEAFKQAKIAMEVADSLKDSIMIAKALSTIGLSEAYMINDTFSTALKDYNRSLYISKRMQDNVGVLHALGLIGNAYLFRSDTAEAKRTYMECIRRGIESHLATSDLAAAMNNLGEIYELDGKYDSAMYYYEKVEHLAIQNRNSTSLAIALENIGNILIRKRNTFANGIDTLILAAKEGMIGNNPYYSKDIAVDLYRLFKKQGNLKNALYWEEISDSLNGLVQNAAIQRKIMSYQIDESVNSWKEKEHAIQEQKDAVTREKIKRQQFLKNMVIAALIIAILFAFYFLNRYRLIRNQKLKIESQKQEVDRAYKIVDHKNNDILASIRYASRIQNALLIPQENLGDFFSEYFILFMPRDIVSGDFYWIVRLADKIYVATADCTGHGVPGAFMSLLGNSFLNEIVLVRHITRPDMVLNELRRNVTNALNPKGSFEETRDGMDMAFCCFDLKQMQLNYAAANNPIWIIRKDKENNPLLIESQYDKFPVGKFIEHDMPFNFHNIDIMPGDIIYTFTDGYRDQFGGDKSKRIGKKGFREFILKIQDAPLKEQRELLRSHLNEWKGESNEQIDDICIIGIKI